MRESLKEEPCSTKACKIFLKLSCWSDGLCVKAEMFWVCFSFQDIENFFER